MSLKMRTFLLLAKCWCAEGSASIATGATNWTDGDEERTFQWVLLSPQLFLVLISVHRGNRLPFANQPNKGERQVKDFLSPMNCSS